MRVMEYGSDEIVVLKGLEGIRRRPDMYLGDPSDPASLTCLVIETLCIAADELVAGTATRATVTLHDDGTITVEDDGLGLSVDEGHGALWIRSRRRDCTRESDRRGRSDCRADLVDGPANERRVSDCCLPRRRSRVRRVCSGHCMLRMLVILQ